MPSAPSPRSNWSLGSDESTTAQDPVPYDCPVGKYKKALIICASILFVFAMVMSFQGRKDLMVVRSLAFEMNQSEGQDLLVQDLKGNLARKLKPYLNQPIWKVRLGEIRQMIMEQGWIENAQIKRRFPNQISIELTPKKIVSVLMDKQGRFIPLYVDSSMGESIASTVVPDVPLIRSMEVLASEPLRQKSIELLGSLPVEGHLNQTNVREMTFDPAQGFILDLYVPETKVVLGMDQYPTKIKRIENVLSYMEVHELQGRVIDATFSKKVLVRLRKGP